MGFAAFPDVNYFKQHWINICMLFQTEYGYRKDFREHVIFTIDPTTARDLDDALHVIPLGNDEYEVSFELDF